MTFRVRIRADASLQIGGGHVMRCLALAARLKAEGAETEFVAARLLPGLEARIAEGGHALRWIEPVEPEAVDGWDGAPMEEGLQCRDAELSAEGGRYDWMVVDHYRLAATWESVVRGGGARLLAIDDLANRRHSCDILLDQSLGRKADDYRRLVTPGTELLTGSRYALLRPEFVAVRSPALANWAEHGPDPRLLVFLGSADLGSVTAEVVEALIDAGVRCPLDVVLAPNAPSVPRIRVLTERRDGIDLHLTTPDMASLMVGARLAIGAAGTTSWERCCVGLPSVTMILAENQGFVAEQLSLSGACVVATDARSAAEVAKRLLHQPDELARMSAAAMAIVDGVGADRVAEHMVLGRPALTTAGALTIRRASTDDRLTVWLWRNDPDTRAVSAVTRPLPWAEHIRWWDSTCQSDMRRIYIAEIHGEPRAMVRFDLRGDQAQPVWRVSIMVRPGARAQGFGRISLARSCARLREETGAAAFEALVAPTNPASQRLFSRLGFLPGRAVESGFVTWTLSVDAPVGSADDSESART